MISGLPLAGLVIFGILFVGALFLILWNKPVLVVYIQLGNCFFARYMVSDLHVPEAYKYFADFLTVILLIQIILQFNKTKTLNIRKPIIGIILFIIVIILSSVYNGSSMIFFIWGLRVFFRFFIFFLACTIFLKGKDIEKLLNFMLKLLPINMAVILFQYFVLGYEDDNLGGLFGSGKGCNNELNLYLTILLVTTLVYYINKKMGFFNFSVNIGLIGIIAALTELKIVYPVIVFEMILVFIFSYQNKRAKTMLVSGILISFIGLIVFFIAYPDWLEIFMEPDRAIDHLFKMRYSAQSYFTLSRLNAGDYVIKNILTEPMRKMFGIGFGNADMFLNVTSSFYDRYEDLVYFGFLYSIIIIEIGIVGLIVYCLFFVIVSYESLRVKRKLDDKNNIYCIISFGISILIFLMIIYDIALIADGAMMIYFTLSFPFILEKDLYEERIDINRNKLPLKLKTNLEG